MTHHRHSGSIAPPGSCQAPVLPPTSKHQTEWFEQKCDELGGATDCMVGGVVSSIIPRCMVGCMSSTMVGRMEG